MALKKTLATLDLNTSFVMPLLLFGAKADPKKRRVVNLNVGQLQKLEKKARKQ